ncbi:uncharacterized protein J3D65DRAFT_78708 [Phyllosticta citribraziliensis]|uniref:Uncharacterized protein n=1 Tax=Phyllosticta citribraziliensis TaxID=989973 RepID=A0ABR1LDL4_9PEZI
MAWFQVAGRRLREKLVARTLRLLWYPLWAVGQRGQLSARTGVISNDNTRARAVQRALTPISLQIPLAIHPIEPRNQSPSTQVSPVHAPAKPQIQHYILHASGNMLLGIHRAKQHACTPSAVYTINQREIWRGPTVHSLYALQYLGCCCSASVVNRRGCVLSRWERSCVVRHASCEVPNRWAG